MSVRASIGLISFVACPSVAFAQSSAIVPYEASLAPGTPGEAAFFKKSNGNSIVEGVRRAEPGQFWFYRFSGQPGSLGRLRLTLEKRDGDGEPVIAMLGPDAKPMIPSISKLADGTLSIQWTFPASSKPGQEFLVGLSAKPLPFGVKVAKYVRIDPDRNGDGISDYVEQALRTGLPASARLIVRPIDGKTPIVRIDASPTPGYDFGAATVFASPATAAEWKGRGASVWTMNEDTVKGAASASDTSVQRDKDDQPLEWHGFPALAPTPERFALERAQFQTGVTAGADGVVLPEPFYLARAGHEAVFKSAWERIFGSPWKAPESGFDARWDAGRLMSSLLTTYTAGLSQEAARMKPSVRRILDVPNPVSVLREGRISPIYRLITQPAIQDAVSDVANADATLRYLGSQRDLPFALSYIESSALNQIVRGTGKRMTISLPDPFLEDSKSRFANALCASLLFPDLRGYSLNVPTMAWSSLTPEKRTRLQALMSLLSELSDTRGGSGNAIAATGDEIGVFLSDSAQWQRETPFASDLDGLFGLSVPLLQRGTPVQIASLERADSAEYLKSFRTLLLSYDFQKPLDAKTQAGLSAWVRKGGSLILFGGSDPYNQIATGWWQKSGKNSPNDALLETLGLKTGLSVARLAEDEDLSVYQPIAVGENDEQTERAIALDLTRFAISYGSVAVRLSCEGRYSHSTVTLEVDGKAAASFLGGSDLENRFIRFENGTQATDGERIFPDKSSVTYQFDNLPMNGKSVILKLSAKGGLHAEAATAKPNDDHVLIGVKEGGAIPASLPRMRIGATYPLTLYPEFPPMMSAPATEAKDSDAIPLYGLKGGGTPVWSQSIEKGTLIYVGVAPGYFASSERSATLLRSLVEYAHQRAGGTYKENGALTVKRGRFMIVKTFGEEVEVPGRSVDLLSADLNVAADRIVAPQSLGIYALLDESKIPVIGFAAGQIIARIETEGTTSFFIKGAADSNGIARIDAAGKKLAGARAMTSTGENLPISAEVQGGTVLLKYPNNPDGIVIRVGWGS